tara:strand:+ start:1714 stop:1890 length:177 start_codon:yes stop_codon:yes gene_type:complete
MQSKGFIISVVVAGAFATKVWCDIMCFMYHRERMRVYRGLIHEGTGLVRLSMQTENAV